MGMSQTDKVNFPEIVFLDIFQHRYKSPISVTIDNADFILRGSNQKRIAV